MATIRNAQRSSATRAALLDATIEALVRYGYHGATSTRIAEISGLTRGAQLHHFKTKAGLVVEAVLHLHAKRIAHYQRIGDVDTRGPWLEVLADRLWESFSDDLWLAAAELWTAARTDEELRTALAQAERTISRRIRDEFAPLHTGSTADPRLAAIPPHRVTAIFGVVVASMRGMSLYEAFDPDPRRAKAQRAELVRALSALLDAPDRP